MYGMSCLARSLSVHRGDVGSAVWTQIIMLSERSTGGGNGLPLTNIESNIEIRVRVFQLLPTFWRPNVLTRKQEINYDVKSNLLNQ